MQNIWVKLTLIAVIIAGCAFAINPPKEKIRLGKDLRGGVSLVYGIRLPADVPDPQQILNQTIEVLKQRINPTGVLDISMTPQGVDRFEIVMPLPSKEVQDLKAAFEVTLQDLISKAEIPENRLVEALRTDTGVDAYGQKIASLQLAYNQLQKAKAELEAATASGSGVGEAEGAVADADIRYDQTLRDVLSLSLDRGRVLGGLRRSNERRPKMDPVTETPILDDDGNEIIEDSAREIEMNFLADEFPHLVTELTAVQTAFDAYDDKRTGFDDPEDLIRLMRGAGVLQFHIALNPDDTQSGVNLTTMRSELAELGPENTTSRIARWFPINEPKQWYDDEAQLESMRADPIGYFRGRGVAAAEKDSQYYILLYTNDANSMFHDPAGVEWSMEQAYRSVDSLGRPCVAFRLDAVGGGLMGKLTGSNVGNQMAIVLDGQVYSAPVLRSQINNQGQISGNFTDEDISYLIRVLAAGSLQARVTSEPIAMNTLGPSIGADNLSRGLEACLLAIIAVAVFMLLYYFFAGAVADLALLFNGLIIFGVMAMLDGTFTLPGLAGIVLTIGMAVDANVLIYERIREELFTGEVDLRGAIRIGYQKALSTIIDANVTNLIICFVLFRTATTEVKGFALTLAIGICATLFTALFVTRQVYYLYTDLFKLKTLPMLPTVFPAIHRALEPNVNWLGLRHILWAVSIVACVTSIALVYSRGELMFDTEFRGGVAVTMQTRITEGTGDDETRLWLPQGGDNGVESRVHQIGAEANAGTLQGFSESQLAVLGELERAVVLTVGETRATDAGVEAQRFQVKVANPADIAEDATIMDTVVAAVTDEFGDDLDVINPLGFRGHGSADHTPFTFLIENDKLGDTIGRPGVTNRVPEFIGGVAVVIEDISPPATIEDLLSRIDRMRQHRDFTDAVGRDVEIIGLTPADAGGYSMAAVVVFDSDLNGLKVNVPFETWDNQLAKREWELISEGLSRRSSLEQATTFSSAVAATLKANAIVAVVLSLLGILVYIWVRFGSFRYSLAAIVALSHDVCIALGLIALTQMMSGSTIASALFIEGFLVDLGVVAALLTIIGYSLNDTIVILDRIRENRGKLPLASAKVINRSINQCFSRTLLTSVTTLLAVMIMYVEGGSGIRPFTFCLLVGLVVGTYSSVAIAAPLVYRGGDDSTDAKAASLADPTTSPETA